MTNWVSSGSAISPQEILRFAEQLGIKIIFFCSAGVRQILPLVVGGFAELKQESVASLPMDAGLLPLASALGIGFMRQRLVLDQLSARTSTPHWLANWVPKVSQNQTELLLFRLQD